MPRNPWQEKKAPPVREEVGIVYADGSAFTVVLQKPTIPEMTASEEQAQEYIQMFCGQDPQGFQKYFTSPDGERILLVPTFCESVAQVEAMQAQEERYSFGDLVGMSVRMPEEFGKLTQAATSLLLQAGGRAPDPPAAGAGSASAPPSTGTSPTPESPGSAEPCSGASTNGSEASSVSGSGSSAAPSQSLTPST